MSKREGVRALCECEYYYDTDCTCTCTYSHNIDVRRDSKLFVFKVEIASHLRILRHEIAHTVYI